MKKILMLDWTVRKAIKEANFDKNPLHGKAVIPHIPIKMEVEVPEEEYDEVRKDPRLHAILHELFQEEVVSYCRRSVVPLLNMLNGEWDRISSLSQFNLRWKQMFNTIEASLPHICETAETKMLKKIAEDASLRQKYKHYRWKVAKQTVVTTLAVGTAAAATAGSVATGGATLGLAVVGLYRSVMSGIKLIRDCAIEAEKCQKNVIYGLAYVSKSYGLMDHKGDGESGRLQSLSQADMAGYAPSSAKKAGNTAKELSFNFFINSVLKWPIKKTLSSVKDIKVEAELWEKKLANLTFQSRDLSVQLNELLEKTDELTKKLAENEGRRQADPGFYAMVKEAARELDREDKSYNKTVEKVEKDVKKLLEKGFYIPSMATWLTIDELHRRAEAGLKKFENLKPVLKALEDKGLAQGTLIASDALDVVLSVALAVAGDTYGPATVGTDQFNDALSFLGSNWFDCLAVPQDVFGTTNSLYSFAVDSCGAQAVQGEAAKVLLEQ
jgi:hypothetical protein